MTLEDMTIDQLDVLTLDDLYVLLIEAGTMVSDGLTVINPSAIINNYGRATVKAGHTYPKADLGSATDDNYVPPIRVYRDLTLEEILNGEE